MSRSRDSKNESGWGDFMKWGAILGAAAAGAAAATYFATKEEPGCSHQQSTAGSSRRSRPIRNLQIDETCTICLNTIEDNCKAFIEPCRHIYHRACLEDWEMKCLATGKKGKCPNCQGYYQVADPAVVAGSQTVPDQCCVCFNDEIEDVKIILQPCLHVFHKICFNRLEFEGEKICPRCKKYYGS